MSGQSQLENVEEKIRKVIEEVGINGSYMEKVEDILLKFLDRVLEEGEEGWLELEICTNNVGQICCTKYYYKVGKKNGWAYLEFEDEKLEPCWTRASPAHEEYDNWNWTGVYSVNVRLF